jgi:Tol biopolymer transport system component
VRVLEADGHLADIPLHVGAQRIDRGATGLRQEDVLALSPDGTRVAQIQNGELGGLNLVTCNLSSATCRTVLHDIPAYGAVWSPDGKTIGYLIGMSECGPCPSPPPPPAGIWLVNADGTGQRQLSANALYVVLSPNSTWDTTVPAVWQPVP